MSFTKCIQDKVTKGVLKKADVDRLNREYDNLVKRYTKTMGDEQAAAQAAEDVINAERSIVTQKRRNEINHVLAQERIVAKIDKQVKGGVAIDTAVSDLLLKADRRAAQHEESAWGHANEFVEKFRSKAFGVYSNREGMIPIVKEMLGESSGNAEAAAYGKALKETFNLLHSQFQGAGGIIGKLDNYFPQSHNASLIKAVDFDEWKSFLSARLDTNKMIDRDTGLPFTKEKLDGIMRQDYDDIITDGRASLQKRVAENKQTAGIYGSEVSSRRQSNRFYHFKDSDAFLEYNRKFSTGDEGLYNTISNVIRGMSRDIAILQVMGTKPNAIMRHLDLKMKSENVGDSKRGLISGMFDVLVGRTDGDANADGAIGMIARGFGNVQNVMRSAMLGSASISAISDSTFIAATARLNGMSAGRTLAKYAKQMNPLDATDRRVARRTGNLAEIATQSILTETRMSGGDNMGGKLTSWMASFTNRASGLAGMTRAAKSSIKLEWQAVLAEHAADGTKWADLNARYRESAESFDITESDWELIKGAKVTKHENGLELILTDDIALTDKGSPKALEASNKIGDWIAMAQDVATNEPDLRLRAITTGAAFLKDPRRGTLGRMFVSNAFMFKTFPLQVMLNHVIPMFKSAAKGKFEHMATVAVGTTLIGGLAVQMKEITKGKDARDMSNPKFWIAGAMQGGGLGLFGDFLFADTNRFGRSPIVDTFLGVGGGVANDVFRVFKGNFDKALEGDADQDKFLRDVFNLAKRNTPAVNLWYSRLIVERLFLDQIEKGIDPQFDRRTRKLENRLYKEQGSKYWWKRGKLAPSKKPQVGKKRNR